MATGSKLREPIGRRLGGDGYGYDGYVDFMVDLHFVPFDEAFDVLENV